MKSEEGVVKVENQIIKVLAETMEEHKEEGWSIKDNKPWTKFLVKVLKNAGEKIGYKIQARDMSEPHNSGEYLNIDVLFFNKSDYGHNSWKSKDYDEPVMPIAAVELENNPLEEQIIYCLWKLLCLRVSTRLLICYQANEDKVLLLKKHLQERILDYSLKEQDTGSLFVIIGDESKKRKQQWWDYYKAYEWGNNRLNEVKIFPKE